MNQEDIDMLDPADPPSPLTAEEEASMREWAAESPYAHDVRRLLATLDAARSSPAPAGLDEIMDRIEDLPTWRYAGERKVSREAVLNILRAATRPAEDAE